MCIDGKHCTMETPACMRGGIMIASQMFVCPGDGNLCKAGYSQCPGGVMSSLCRLDVNDMSKAEGCAICCPSGADMAPPTGG
jgi:hypothetical protein